jgi:hypothetical protein
MQHVRQKCLYFLSIVSYIIWYILFPAGCAYFGNNVFNHYNKVTFAIFENRSDKSAFVNFGTCRQGHIEYDGNTHELKPGHAIYERIQTELGLLFSEQICAIIRKTDQFNDDVDKVLIIIKKPINEADTVRVISIFNDSITENYNPMIRQWHKGKLEVYQDEPLIK